MILLLDIGNQELKVREYFKEQKRLVQLATEEKINAIYSHQNFR